MRRPSRGRARESCDLEKNCFEAENYFKSDGQRPEKWPERPEAGRTSTCVSMSTKLAHEKIHPEIRLTDRPTL